MNSQDFREQYVDVQSFNSTEQIQQVMNIINKVRKDKDEALFDYTELFDKQKLSSIKVPETFLQESYEQLDEDIKKALLLAKERIITYQNQIKYQNREIGEFTYVYQPLAKIGVYIPGGTALYPSSVLMTVILAQVADVKEIHVTTPVFERHNITFATLYMLGIKDVYTIGGAQAIAALAYGTETIPKVDKIVGPGNAYVALAKRLVYGDVGIDAIAGPSEILLYVDEGIDVDAVVYDIFAQAEHDINARTFLLAESQEVIDQIETRITQLVDKQTRNDIINQSLKDNHYVIVDSRDNLLDIINHIAPEHVSIQHKDQDEIAKRIHYAGAVFKGHYSPEAIGDYIAGPSHVLPTNGTARYSHGLTVNDFLTSHVVINLNKETYYNIVEAASLIAQTEHLYAHQASLTIRKEDDN